MSRNLQKTYKTCPFYCQMISERHIFMVLHQSVASIKNYLQYILTDLYSSYFHETTGFDILCFNAMIFYLFGGGGVSHFLVKK